MPSRRKFIKTSGLAVVALSMPNFSFPSPLSQNNQVQRRVHVNIIVREFIRRN